jgi:hypothetical protein
MAQLIQAQSFTRSEAWAASRGIYLPSMPYSLPVTSFTRQEVATIQRIPTQVLLSELGLN